MKKEKMIDELTRFCSDNICCNCALVGCPTFSSCTKEELAGLMIKAGIYRNQSKEIKIKYFDQFIEPIYKIGYGDWIDLRSAESVDIKKGDYYLIRLGVGMILPKGYEAHVLPRSSTPSKFGIMCANSMGVIDNSYSGDGDEWKFPAVAIRDTHIEKGDRICQFRIVKNQPGITFTIVNHLNDTDRGGIGSTGTR